MTDEFNILKHGVSLGDAVDLDWDTLDKSIDMRYDYGEMRLIGYGLIFKMLYCVVFTDRSNQRRIISLRKANDREKRYYEQIADH